MLEGLSKPADIAQAAEAFYKKLKMADTYQTTSVFNGNVTFIKAKDNFVQLGDDYGLGKVSIVATPTLKTFAAIFNPNFFNFFRRFVRKQFKAT